MLLLTMNEWVGPGPNYPPGKQPPAATERQIAFATRLPLAQALERVRTYQAAYNAQYKLALCFRLLAVHRIPDTNAEALDELQVKLVEELPEAYLVGSGAKESTMRTITKAAADVLSERTRQMEVEGWTPAHDDEYRKKELSAAAACYADAFDPMDPCPAEWPWARAWWKPKDYRSNLVRAAALLLAEIERLDRKAAGEQQAG